MLGSTPFQYISSGFSEPGIFVELYLPKRAEYQAVLYATLTEGFNLRRVKDHLTNNGDDIRRVLQHHDQWRSYSEESIQKLQPFYEGYSMYEVDGVFLKTLNEVGRPVFQEERTQVIRIMFLPDVDALRKALVTNDLDHKQVLDIIKEFLRISGHRRGKYGENIVFPDLINRLVIKNDPGMKENEENGNLRAILDYTEKWFDDVGLFLFGYVVFRICEGLKELREHAADAPIEKVLWLTSFWNLNVNRVSYSGEEAVRLRRRMFANHRPSRYSTGSYRRYMSK